MSMLTMQSPEGLTVYIFTVLVQRAMLVESIDAMVKQTLAKRNPSFKEMEMLSPLRSPELYHRAFLEVRKFINENGMRIEAVDTQTGVLSIRDVKTQVINERAIRLFVINSGDVRIAVESN